MLSGELDGSDRHHFFQRLRRHLSFVVSDCQDELANAGIGSTYTVAAFCCLRSQPESGQCASSEGWRVLWELVPPGQESEPRSLGSRISRETVILKPTDNAIVRMAASHQAVA